ncbi:HAD family hydrolase [Amylibacter sp.]|jgi:D-glycero-D-manno-heptose 1,7-bisphosphate phosphatase|nr:HAD family hydrolase [Amylibacter sp.]
MDQKALFLDRDGVVNIDFGYVYKIDNFVFIDGIFKLVRYAKLNGFLIFIITNQSGIGRGYYSINDFNVLSSWMMEQFKKRRAEVKKIYFSPYHPTEGKGQFRRNDFSRKPNPGMILQASKEYNLDLKKSVLVGDKMSDIEAGERAGVGVNILLTKNKKHDRNQSATSLEEILKYLE